MTDELIKKRIKELDSQYEQAVRQLKGLENTINDLKKYANHIVSTGDFSLNPTRMSDEAWRRRASEMIRELVKYDKENYPTFKSVLVPIYIKLRNVYGIVLEQLRKDYRYNNDTLRYPSAFEAISGDDMVRDIFDSILINMFPEDYFKDEALENAENGGNCTNTVDISEDTLQKIIKPLAIKYNDNSFGYANTFNKVCNTMDCCWNNLQTRYKNKSNIEEVPSKQTIIMNNAYVFRKFKKTVRMMISSNES